ncbi:hypothetical protein BH10PLA1_BH10PLA1_13510 [soil metagenome]
MADFNRLSEIWETNAEEDAMWAVLTDPKKTGQKWDRETFYRTGRNEIDAVFNYLLGQKLEVQTQGTALDFGCGVGRLTQALAGRFTTAIGVDISQSMVDQAKKNDQTNGKCEFVVNKKTDLSQFTDAQFIFIYSSIVLQHMDPSFASLYIKEFVRLLKPNGLLVFQIPDQFIPPAVTLRERYYQLRASLSLGTRLRRILGAAPKERSASVIEMNLLPEAKVRKLVSDVGGEVINVVHTNSTDSDFNGEIKFSTTPPKTGFVSNQYVVRKSR